MTDKIQFNHVSKVFKIRDSKERRGENKEFTAIDNVHFSVKRRRVLYDPRAPCRGLAASKGRST